MDMVTQETVALFKADSEPLTVLSWDSPGTLLLSSGDSGQELIVWRISPRGKPTPHKKLYVLQRGMSLNHVRDVFWSGDSSLVAFTSRTNGTTHVFPIRVGGGEVDVSTHLNNPAKITFKDVPVVTPVKLCAIHSDKSAAKNQFAGTSTFLSTTEYDKKRGTATIVCANLKLDGVLVRHDV
jgi:hypothetical protein